MSRTVVTGPATVHTTVSTPHHEVRVYTRPLLVAHGITSTQAYTARAVSALVGNILTSPFYVVQTLAQVGTKEGRKSYVQIIEDLWNKEGLSAFFRGSIVGAVKFLSTAGLNYLVYLGVKKLLAEKSGIISVDNHQIANAVSIIISSILTYPLETIRTRLILDFDHKNYKGGAIDVLTNTISNEGWSGLFHGSVLSAISNYVLLEAMERIWTPIRVGLAIVPNNLVDAALQSLLVQTLYYPIDTLVKMVQAPTYYKSLHPDVEYNGVVEAATATIAKHGVLSLWRGYSVAALKVAPYIAIVSLSFQGTANLFDEANMTQVVRVPTKVTTTRVVNVVD